MELTSEQRALRDSVRDLLRRHEPALDAAGTAPGADEAAGDSRTDPAQLWQLLCGIGVAGLAVPEQFGGAGAGPVEVAIVAEELGRVLAPTPMLGSAILATGAILASGDPDACERLVPRLASGEAIGALAWTGQPGGWDPGSAAFHAAGRAGGGWTLTGAAHYVLEGDHADVLIAVARMPDDSVGLFEVDPGQPGVDRELSASMDQTRRLAVVRLAAAADGPLGTGTGGSEGQSGDDGSAGGGNAAGGSAALARARDLACIALAAEQVGAAARALELTVSYTGTRIQFGRSIASFQAIQHRLANLHVLVESARALAYRAAQVASKTDGEVTMLADAAKAYCSEALSAVAAEMIQLHGAIGATWEHDAHRYFKRAHGSSQLFGAPSAHLTRIATALIDA
jgi:alkylation response protein AidB-like acyl-CoA dehydrogenase